MDTLQEFKSRMEERKYFFELADEPFEYKHYQVNYDGAVYLPQQVMIDRCNILFDKWSLTKGTHEICKTSWSVGVNVRMTSWINGVERITDQYGVNKITIKQGKTEPSNDALEQSIKSAISDGMKKCASWFGIGSHVYRGEIKVILPYRNKNSKVAVSKEYKWFIDKLQLNEDDFYHGLAVLPDSFRTFYEEKKWQGLFQSDVLAIRGNQPPSTDQQVKTYNGQSNHQETEPTISKGQIRLMKELASEIQPRISEQEILELINKNFALRVPDLKSIKIQDYQRIYGFLKDTKKFRKEKNKIA